MIKTLFLGKNCLVDRNLSDLSNLKKSIDDAQFDYKNILLLNQIHSNEVITIDHPNKIYGPTNLPKADAIVSSISNVVLGVITADCAPILFYDKKNNIIAAAHAGWRGAKSGIISSTVKAMQKLGAQEIEAQIGPMIQQKSYEIDQNFYNDFLLEDAANAKFFISGIRPNHYQFDLPAYAIKKLQEFNIKITNQNIDTYSDEKNYFSFRRSSHKNEKDCGRNLSVIGFT